MTKRQILLIYTDCPYCKIKGPPDALKCGHCQTEFSPAEIAQRMEDQPSLLKIMCVLATFIALGCAIAYAMT